MWKYLWVRKSAQAKWWLEGAVVVWILLFVLASWNPAGGLFSYGEWTNRDLAVMITMISLLGAASLMHGGDRKFGGWGFQDVYHSRGGGSHETRARNFVAPVLTVESIRAAMTAGILAILLDDRNEYLPHVDGDLYWRSVGDVLKSPESVFYLSIVGALTASLMTTMAALLCYEYASRFKWTSIWPRVDLLQKAFYFGTFGFYCLMWSLAVVGVLLHYHLAFITILFVFVVMWLYYFFPESRDSDEQVIRRLVGSLFRAENGTVTTGDPEPADILATDYLPITRARGQVDESREDTLQKIASASRSLLRDVDRATIEVSMFMGNHLAIARTLLPTTDESTSPPTDASYRNLHVFLKREKQWKCVAWQVTEVR